MRLASKLCLLNKAEWHFWKPFLMDQTHHYDLSSCMYEALRDLGAVISQSFSSAEIPAALSFPECQYPFCYCIKHHTVWCLLTLTSDKRQNCVPNAIISCACRAHNGLKMRMEESSKGHVMSTDTMMWKELCLQSPSVFNVHTIFQISLSSSFKEAF